ncbi:MAG: SgcJ/EcaC family oxidoreductase [Acidobacteriota bacterium]
MNRFVLAMLAVTTLSGCTARDSATTTTPPAFGADDESAVRALVNEFANTWNRHDMTAMHALDTDDVEWINVVGHHWRGKANVYKGHVAIHKGMAAQGSVSVESVTVRSIAPAVAVAVATMHFSASQDPRYAWVVASKTTGSFTMVKRDGIWRIAHFQNTVIDPKAENDDETKWDATGFPPPGHPLHDAGLRDR